MTVSWGPWQGSAPFRWQAGLEGVVSPSEVGPDTTSVVITWNVHLRRENTAAATAGSAQLTGTPGVYLGGWEWESGPDYTTSVLSHEETVATTFSDQYRVQHLTVAENTYGTTLTASAQAAIPARPPALPTPPTAASATYVSDNQIDVTWTRPANASTPGFQWEGVLIKRWSLTTGTWVEMRPETLTGTSIGWSDRGVKANDQYRYEVYATNRTGDSTTGAMTGYVLTAPATPTQVRARPSAGNILVYWRDNALLETGFEILDATDGGEVLLGSVIRSPFVHESPSTLVGRVYRVRAVAPGPLYSPWSVPSAPSVYAPPFEPVATTANPDDEVFRGHRVEHHWVELLDSNDNRLRTLKGTSGGEVSQNLDSDIQGGFQFTVVANDDIDWMSNRFQPWVMVNGESWPLGVYLPSSPELSRTSTSLNTYSVAAHDKTIILAQDLLVETYSLPPGTPVVGEVVALILGVGEDKIAVTESAASTRTAMTWQVKTPLLQVVNELLVHINYKRLWVDGFGQFRVEPYIEPANRPIRATFREGDLSIHAPEWSRSQDIANVPNRVVLTSTGTDQEEEMIGIANNTDPLSPYSYPRRGDRWLARPYENVDAADQATLDALAARYLANATRAVANISLEHAVVPLELGDVVHFVSGPVDSLAVVNEFAIPLEVGSRVKALWNEVNP